MRYDRGGLEINPIRDIPLLRYILQSRFISRTQLFAFMQLGYYDTNRRCFNWRLARLVDHGLVRKHHVPSMTKAHLYTITHSGIACLQHQGEFYAAALPVSNTEIDEYHIVHTLELNEIHLALLRARVMVSWIPEIKLRSTYLLGVLTYAKVYDAIVEVSLGEKSVRFALEYERTQKTMQEYARIRESLETEHQLEALLYLMPTHDLLVSVAQFFAGTKRRMYFCLVRDFKDRVLDAEVSDTRRIRSFPLRQALAAM